MSSTEVLRSMLNVFDGSDITAVKLELSLQVLAWVKLSALDKLPVELKVAAVQGAYSYEKPITVVNKALTYASQQEEDSGHTQLFFGTNTRYEAIPFQKFNSLLRIAKEALGQGLLSRFIIPEHFYQSLPPAEANGLLPSEVMSLMGAIATADDASKNETIYCPHDNSAIFSSRMTIAGRRSYLEICTPTSIPWLTSLLSELDFSISFGRFLAQPTLSRAPSIGKFDIAIAYPPTGKLSEPITRWQNRLKWEPIETASMSILAILDIIDQTAERAIIAVPNNVLFGLGAAQLLRKQLVEQGLVESVIRMHPALLFKTSLQISVLVLNFKDRCEHVRFIDGGADDFIEKDRLNRAYLKKWPELLQAITSDAYPSTAQTVTTQQVINNDYSLDASRYVRSSKLSKAYSIIDNPAASHDKSQLARCAKLIRSSPRLCKAGSIEAFEVVTSDFPKYGYLPPPQKTVQINEQGLEPEERKLFVHPYDVLLSIKGTTGRVAIAPPNLPSPGSGGWLANQSCLIIRADPSKIDPIALFMYLNSDIGQILLEQIVSGAKTPMIQLKPLKNLNILIPDKAAQQKTVKAFIQQVDLQAQIQQIRREQSHLSKDFWSL